MNNFADAMAEARQALSAADTQGAFYALCPLLTEIGEDSLHRDELFTCFAEIAVRRWGTAWRELVLVAKDPSNVKGCYSLGSALIDRGHPDIAVGVLTHAVQLHPENRELLHELVAALELQGHNRAALALLRDAPVLVRQSFLHRYLEAFNCTMSGEFDAARELLPSLASDTSPQETVMVERVASILARSQHLGSLGLQTTTSGRLCVLTGALLLDNFAASPDIFPQVKTQLTRLSAVLEAWDLHPKLVLAPPDPLSHGLAMAAGRMLGLPVERWLGETVEGLVTCWDPRQMLPELQNLLRQRNAGQLYFAHRARVGIEQITCPDLLGCADTTGYLPWEAGDDDPFADIPREPNPKELADAVLNSTALPDMPNEIESQMRSFAVAVGKARPAARLQNGQRDRLWAGVLMVSQ